MVVFGQILRHPLRKRGDENPAALVHRLPDLCLEMIHLMGRLLDSDLRVDQAGRPDDLLHEHAAALLELVIAGRGGNIEDLMNALLELAEVQRPVVQGTGQPEPVLHQGSLPGLVSMIHPGQLGDRQMALVEKDQEILREVIDQRVRGLSGDPSVEMPRVVLDPRAVPHLAQHLQIVAGSLLQALHFQDLVLHLQRLETFIQFLLDPFDRLVQAVGGCHVVAGRPESHLLEFPHGPSPQRVDLAQDLHRVPEELDAHRTLVFIGGEDVHHVSPHAEGAAVEIVIVPGVLELDQSIQELLPQQGLSLLDEQEHPMVVLRRPNPVDARHAGNDDHITTLEQGAGGGMAHPVDLFVDRCVLLDVGVRGRQVGFRLVIVVVTDEVFDRVVREEGLELSVKLSRKGLVRGDDQGGPVDPCHDVGHGVGLAGAGDAQEHLVLGAPVDLLHQISDRFRLIPLWLEFRNELESIHRFLAHHSRSMRYASNACRAVCLPARFPDLPIRPESGPPWPSPFPSGPSPSAASLPRSPRPKGRLHPAVPAC